MDITQELYKTGFVFLSEWQKSSSTYEVAEKIGNIFPISKIAGHNSIPDIQRLLPREKSEKLSNQYSGHFGLEEFPLHTDLAHWRLPPKYLMLRCEVGSELVSTNLLPIKNIYSDLYKLNITKAVVTPRKENISGNLCLLPLISNVGNEQIIRWDSVFLKPFNTAAKNIKYYIEKISTREKIISLKLAKKGDTLIINNWNTLHGRSSARDLNRVIERIYFN